MGMTRKLLLIWLFGALAGTSGWAGRMTFPHYGDGGGLSMAFSISNLSAETARGRLAFFDSEGQPQVLPLASGPAAELPLELAPQSSFVVRSDGSSAPVRSGFAVLEMDQDEISAVAFFGFRAGGEAGIFPAQEGERFGVFVERAGGVDSGVAVVRSGAAAVTARFYDETGLLVGEAEVPLEGRYVARLVGDLFPALPALFQGVLRLESAEPFRVTALRFGPALLTALPLVPEGATDVGAEAEKLLARRSRSLLGLEGPLERRATAADYVPREEATAMQRQLLAPGLQAEYVTRNLASPAEMMVFYPNDLEYTHLVLCIEESRRGTTPGGNSGLNASVQRVDVATGEVEHVLRGMRLCDGIALMPWGTVLVTEESEDGRSYEILDPINTTNHWIADRDTGDVRDGIDSPEPSNNVALREALPTIAWEGVAALPSGVVVAADERTPGLSEVDGDGGAVYKFVPDQLRTGEEPITDLDDSPLVAGRTFALQISCVSPDSDRFPEHGQGCEVGEATWVEVDPLRTRATADANGATGYLRPEDLEIDPTYTGTGFRFCWANTGRSNAQNWGEVLCVVDENPAGEGVVESRNGRVYLADPAQPGGFAGAVVQRFYLGANGFHSPDNLAFQPGSGILYVVEDARFGEIFACLPDGADRDLQTDGCLRMLSIIDPEADPTALIFDGTGEVAFYVLHEGEQPESLRDFESEPLVGRTDDLIRITGFRVPRAP